MKTFILMTLGSLFLLSGCMNEFKFRADDLSDPQATTPVPDNEATRNPDSGTDVGNPKPDDPTMDPDHPDYPIVVYKNGTCTKDPFQVLPCLTCKIDQKPIEVPLSVKASQLLSIMESGCAMLNKSDPVGYKPPTRDMIFKFLNRADVKNYPDSTPTARQKKHLDLWLQKDPVYLKRLFGGLWYNPPYSDDFETYFGLEPKEARYFFCYQESAPTFLTTPLYSIGYSNCIHDGGPGQCQERKEYIQANVYRNQLATSISESVSNPYNEEELVPSNRCKWETMAGRYNVEMENKLIEWKNQGYEIVVYFESTNPRCESVATASIPLNAKVTVGGKLCTDF